MIEHGDTHTNLSNPPSLIYDLKTDARKERQRQRQERREILLVLNVFER